MNAIGSGGGDLRTTELTDLAHYDVLGFILEVVLVSCPDVRRWWRGMPGHHRLAVRDAITEFWAWRCTFQRKVLTVVGPARPIRCRARHRVIAKASPGTATVTTTPFDGSDSEALQPASEMEPRTT
jgi:hypothetical protein